MDSLIILLRKSKTVICYIISYITYTCCGMCRWRIWMQENYISHDALRLYPVTRLLADGRLVLYSVHKQLQRFARGNNTYFIYFRDAM